MDEGRYIERSHQITQKNPEDLSRILNEALDSERKRLADDSQNIEILKEQSIRDPLTELFNRRGLKEAIGKIDSIIQAHKFSGREKRREKPMPNIVIFYIDIDDFKEINEKYGHDAGDEIIITVAKILKESTKKDKDFVIRAGGDEYVIIAIDTSIEEAKIIAERIQSKEKSISVQDASVSVTLSIGFAELTTDVDTCVDTIQRADAALFCSKAANKNTFRSWTDVPRTTRKRIIDANARRHADLQL